MNGVPVAARATAYLTGRKRTREGYWFLLRVQIGRRRSAASTATLAGDGDGAGLANRGDAATFRRLDPANRLGVVLRQCTKGQDGRSINVGGKIRRRQSLPAAQNVGPAEQGEARHGLALGVMDGVREGARVRLRRACVRLVPRFRP